MGGCGLLQTCLPDDLGFAFAGTEFEQLPGSFGCEEALYLVAKVLFIGGPVKRDLTEELLEMIASQRLNGGKVRFGRIELGLDLGFGKNNAAFATGTADDPLRSLTVFVQQGHKLVGASPSMKFELFLDLFEFLIEGSELLVNGETPFHQSSDGTCMSGCVGFHRPSPTRVQFLEFIRADKRRQVPTSADIRR